MDAAEYKRLRYATEWWQHVPLEQAQRAHNRNVKACREAWDQYQDRDPSRPVRVLAVYGSGRNVKESCAHEEANSKLLLRTGLTAIEEDPGVVIEEAELRRFQIEPCNGCLSTASTWCHFPCTCFPLDPMQALYPMVLRADVVLMSTGVNQSMVSSRLKLFIDRLISLDGGIYVPEGGYQNKDAAWLRRAQALEAAGSFVYSPRMAGKVAGYFITSKDLHNELGEPFLNDQNYEAMLTAALYSSSQDYGLLHAEPWYAISGANPTEGYLFDKAHHDQDTAAHSRAREVVLASVHRARQTLKGPPPVPKLDRVNRT